MMKGSSLLEGIDFALDEMPGDQMHQVLRAYRERGPIQSTPLPRPASSYHYLSPGTLSCIHGYRNLSSPCDVSGLPLKVRLGKALFRWKILKSIFSIANESTPAFRSRAVGPLRAR